jgi:hypothetical protein
MKLLIKMCIIGFFAVAFKEINLMQFLNFDIVFHNFRYGKFIIVDSYILRKSIFITLHSM